MAVRDATIEDPFHGEGTVMAVQILRKKFTVGQYPQMIASGILTDLDHPHGRGRVSLPRAICLTAKQIPCNVQLMMLMTVAILHWARRPRPYGDEI